MHQSANNSRISTNMNKDNDVCDRILRSVICRVEQFEITRSHRKSVVYMVVSLVAFFTLVPAIYYILVSSSQSGFGSYISLIASDSTYMIQNWKEHSLSIVSSLPITGVMASLLVLLITMYTMRRTIRYSEYSQSVKRRLIAT